MSCGHFLLPTRCLDLCSARYGNDAARLTVDFFFFQHSLITGEKYGVPLPDDKGRNVTASGLSPYAKTVLSDHITFLNVATVMVCQRVRNNLKQ